MRAPGPTHRIAAFVAGAVIASALAVGIVWLIGDTIPSGDGARDSETASAGAEHAAAHRAVTAPASVVGDAATSADELVRRLGAPPQPARLGAYEMSGVPVLALRSIISREGVTCDALTRALERPDLDEAARVWLVLGFAWADGFDARHAAALAHRAARDAAQIATASSAVAAIQALRIRRQYATLDGLIDALVRRGEWTDSVSSVLAPALALRRGANPALLDALKTLVRDDAVPSAVAAAAWEAIGAAGGVAECREILAEIERGATDPLRGLSRVTDPAAVEHVAAFLEARDVTSVTSAFDRRVIRAAWGGLLSIGTDEAMLRVENLLASAAPSGRRSEVLVAELQHAVQETTCAATIGHFLRLAATKGGVFAALSGHAIRATATPVGWAPLTERERTLARRSLRRALDEAPPAAPEIVDAVFYLVAMGTAEDVPWLERACRPNPILWERHAGEIAALASK